MSVKLSERIKKQLELNWCDPADAANELGVFLHNILSEVEALERDHEILEKIRKLLQPIVYDYNIMKSGVSEEAKQE